MVQDIESPKILLHPDVPQTIRLAPKTALHARLSYEQVLTYNMHMFRLQATSSLCPEF